MTESNVNCNYKDTVFRMLFKDKENLLSLYNAVNGTTYTDTENLEITTLKDAQYVDMVRKFAAKKPLAEAVKLAVDTCIKEGILEDFLRKNRAEAIEMSIFEYDEEKHLKSEREIWKQAGIAEGKQAGIIEGESRLTKLLQLMMQGNQSENVEKVLADLEYREKLYKEYHL